MANIKIKAILNIKDEKEVYTKAIITGITTKISRKGITFYIIEIADELRKITVCLSPEYFEQEIKTYANKPIIGHTREPRYKVNDNLELINFINKPCCMKIKCVMSEDNSSIKYFLCSIQEAKKMTFRYITENLSTEANNMIQTKEYIEDIHNIENYKGYIDYKIALENVSLFEELCLQDNCAEITLCNLDEEIVDIYKQIFEFIANGGYLIYHSGGIVKRHSPEKTRRLAYERKILSDLKQIFHGCFVRSVNYKQEKEICSLIFDERDRLNRE